jgi:hypothetical protein
MRGETMKRWMLAAGLFVLIISGLDASAQDIPGLQAEDATQTSAPEKLSFAQAALDEMSQSLENVTRLYESAKERDSDAEMLQCVLMKQASIKALLDVSIRSNEAMQEALANGANERAEHEFRKVAVALSKARQFLAEAEACAGQGSVVAGDTQLEVLTTQGISDADETDSTDEDVTVGTDPPSSS